VPSLAQNEPMAIGDEAAGAICDGPQLVQEPRVGISTWLDVGFPPSLKWLGYWSKSGIPGRYVPFCWEGVASGPQFLPDYLQAKLEKQPAEKYL
jgi:hypothetical protein